MYIGMLYFFIPTIQRVKEYLYIVPTEKKKSSAEKKTWRTKVLGKI